MSGLEREVEKALGKAKQSLADARGLCQSESNRWRGGDQPISQKTADHWHLVAIHLMELEVLAAALADPDPECSYCDDSRAVDKDGNPHGQIPVPDVYPCQGGRMMSERPMAFGALPLHECDHTACKDRIEKQVVVIADLIEERDAAIRRLAEVEGSPGTLKDWQDHCCGAEKRVEKALPCTQGCVRLDLGHMAICPASGRPAVLALVKELADELIEAWEKSNELQKSKLEALVKRERAEALRDAARKFGSATLFATEDTVRKYLCDRAEEERR